MAKIIPPLTDVQPRNAKPKEKPYKLADGGGLYLLVNPDGGKYWRMKYRFGGKEKTLAFGKYPDISLGEARKRRQEAKTLLQQDIDPGENKKAQKAARKEAAANSFEVIALEWFAKQKPSWVESHASRVIARLQADVFPWIGTRPIAGITAPEYLAVFRRIEERGAIETAHRVKSICGQIHRYAVATGRADSDPTGALKGALSPVNSGHFAAVTDPKQVVQILRMIDSYTGTFPVACALKIAPYVFVRPGELRKAKWADIDFDTAEWRYFVTKTKTPHIVPLARQVVSILKELQPLTGNSPYVFPSARTGERPMSDNAILAALRRMGISKDEMTGHGFRAMARTILDEVLGCRPDLIEHQLAHAVKDPNGRAYNRTAHLPERKRMMQAWADYLDSLKAGKILHLPSKAA
ncbi:MAG: integrase arm-type DNA-binding domain-containing protein [Oxalobacter formigenes]|nr:integrase arm-type DNA-binding domain-containing protein [Oxalobacter formigenes]